MGWFEDATAWVNTAVSDAVDFVEDAAEDVGDVFEDAGAAIASAAQDAGQAVEQAAAATAQAASAVAQTVATAAAAVVDRVGDVAAAVVDRVGDVAAAVVDQVGNAAETSVDWLSEAFDSAGAAIDSVFNGPSTAPNIETGGLIRTDWSDDVFYVDDVDRDDVADSASATGVDWAPAPYVEGHLDVLPDGGISIGGVLQGTLALSDVADDVFARNADGSWGSSASEEFGVDRSLDFEQQQRDDGGLELELELVDAGDIQQTDLAGSIYIKYSPPELVDFDVSAVGVLDIQQQNDVGLLQQELVEEAAPAGDMAQLDVSPTIVFDVVLQDDFSVALSGTDAVETEVDSVWDDIGQ